MSIVARIAVALNEHVRAHQHKPTAVRIAPETEPLMWAEDSRFAPLIYGPTLPGLGKPTIYGFPIEIDMEIEELFVVHCNQCSPVPRRKGLKYPP